MRFLPFLLSLFITVAIAQPISSPVGSPFNSPVGSVTGQGDDTQLVANLVEHNFLAKGQGILTPPSAAGDCNRLAPQALAPHWVCAKANETRRDSRRVENLAPHSEDLTSGLWTIADITANATETATTIELTGTNNSYHYKVITPSSSIVGRTFVFSADVTWVSGSTTVNVIASGGTPAVIDNAQLDYSDGLTKRVSFNVAPTNTGNLNFGLDNRGAASATGDGQNPTKVTFTNIQIEESTGRLGDALTTPSEYVSSTHNSSNATGVQYFNYENPNIVTDSGDRIPIANLKGTFMEGAATNLISQPRDLTNAAWTKDNGVINTLNQVGIDGQPDTATYLEDNDGTTFESVYEFVTVPADSNPNLFVAGVKKDSDTSRFVGVQFQLSAGGATTSEIAHLNTSTGSVVWSNPVNGGRTSGGVISEGEYWRVWATITNDGANTLGWTVAYPSVGAVIGTVSASATGSAVFDDMEIQTNKTYPTSPLLNTGGHARLSDEDMTAQEENINNAQWSLEHTVTLPYSSTDRTGTINIITKGANAFITYDFDNTRFEITDGTNTATVTKTFLANQTINLKAIGSTVEDVLQIGADGTAGTATNYDDALPSGDFTLKAANHKYFNTHRRYKGGNWLAN